MIRCVVEQADCPWLSESPISGTIGPGGSHNITVSINTTGLGSNYTAEIVIASNDPDENPKTVPVTLHVVPVTSYDITLYAGWNLISLPLIPEDSDITEVISATTLASGNISNVGMVYWYDSVAETYLAYKPGVGGNLPTMEDGKGYWASVANAEVLTVTGTTTPVPPSPPPTYNVTEGWNLIGFKSTEAMANKVYLANLIDDSPNYSMLWGYNAEAQEYFIVYHPSMGEGGNMEPGHGYWLSATADGTIVPPAS